MLVDSPGIGENSAMDSVITHFVSEHHIMGFIYVIKSDNAGGVDEDRVSFLNLRLVILCCYNIITCIRRFLLNPKDKRCVYICGSLCFTARKSVKSYH